MNPAEILTLRFVKQHLKRKGKGGNYFFDATIHGTRIRHSTGTPDKRIALIHVMRWLSRSLRTSPANPKLSDLRVETLCRNVDTARSTSYVMSVDRTFDHLIDCIGDIPIRSVTEVHVASLQSHLSTMTARSRTGAPHSSSRATINSHLAKLRASFNYALFLGWINTNPF